MSRHEVFRWISVVLLLLGIWFLAHGLAVNHAIGTPVNIVWGVVMLIIWRVVVWLDCGTTNT